MKLIKKGNGKIKKITKKDNGKVFKKDHVEKDQLHFETIPDLKTLKKHNMKAKTLKIFNKHACIEFKKPVNLKHINL